MFLADLGIEESGLDKLINGKVELANLNGVMVINKGNIEKYELTIDITAEGETVGCKVAYIITTEGVPEVTAPQDADKYMATPNLPGIG